MLWVANPYCLIVYSIMCQLFSLVMKTNLTEKFWATSSMLKAVSTSTCFMGGPTLAS